jgi:excisionase family DNA binding protein
MNTPANPAARKDSFVFLTPEAVCKLLSISRRTLRRWIQSGLIQAPLRLGADGRLLRWHPADLVDSLRRLKRSSEDQAV